MAETPRGPEGRAGPDIAGLAIAAGLLCLAGFCLYDVWELGSAPSYSQVGPEVAAEVVGVGLAILAVLNGFAALRGGFIETEAYDPGAVLLIVAGFAALIAIIWLGGGFIAGMTVVFVATSCAFGRRKIVTDIVIGAVLAIMVYLVFTKLLTLSLPSGPLERLLG